MWVSLHEIVFLDGLKRLLERQLAVGHEAERFVGARCAHVRQLLFLGYSSRQDSVCQADLAYERAAVPEQPLVVEQRGGGL